MAILYLASQSYSRAMLLKESQIDFIVIHQDADESQCDWNLPIEKVVESIAVHKMEHLVLQPHEQNAVVYVLTADTLVQDAYGALHGKPIDYQDAVEKIKKLRNGTRIVTSFCLDKKRFSGDHWIIEQRVQVTVEASCSMIIPDNAIDDYLAALPLALKCAGAMALEGYGMQFVKSLSGSYSALLGLPLYELRQALQAIGFYD
ncbi:MAG: Maf family protein [Candidatus Babeliaceae bacterium]